MKPDGWFLSVEPYAVQSRMFELGRDRPKFGEWADPGLGKTAVALADFLYAIYVDEVSDLVVVAPSYLRTTWQSEAQRWGVMFPVFLYPDVPNEREEHSVVVLGYESLLYSGGNFLEEFMKRRPCMLVLDESQSIKKFNGAWTKAVMTRFRPLARRCRTLTGTPLVNNVLDLWSQLRMNGAIEGVNPFQFRARHAVLGGFMAKQIVGTRNEEELHRIIDSCAFRARREDWLADLPERIYPSPLQFEMTRAQTEMYRSMWTEYWATLPNEEDAEVFAAHVGNAYEKSLQISRGFVIDNAGKVLEIMSTKDNPALRAAKFAVESSESKVLVFAFHRHAVNMLERELAEFGCRVLRGGMTDDEIDTVKSSFNRDPAVKVMVAQTAVGSRGHTLIGVDGHRCTTTLFFENSFSLGDRIQAEARNHRIGQTKAVRYLDISGSSIDKKIIDALQRKTDLVRAVVDAIRSTP